MAESRHEGSSANRSGGTQTLERQAEGMAELGREGARRAADATNAAASAAQRSGSGLAECAQEITTAWTRYAEEVMRHTSDASQALLRARTFTEILEVQAKLLRENMQAFLDQSVKIAESAGRMATRPLEALKEASSEQSRG